jgi:hypothetical protein
MTVRRVDAVVGLAVVLLIVGVSLLPSPRDRNPPVPETADHRTVRLEKDCLSCHGEGGVRAVPTRHPKRQDCFKCHRGGRDA